MKKAAIFDIDGTILKNTSSERIFFWYLIEKKIVKTNDLLQFLKAFFFKLLRLKGFFIRENKYYLKNNHYHTVVTELGECFRERIIPHISKKAIEEIKLLKKEGYMIILLSGTLSPFVECFTNYCRADLGIGTRLGVDKSGVITGEIDGIHSYSSGKVKAIKLVAEKYHIDLSSSCAYANQYSDVKFMRMVKSPVAVNASPLLWLYAKFKRWRIVEF